jgi:LCP family protein required for cell wall assembly
MPDYDPTQPPPDSQDATSRPHDTAPGNNRRGSDAAQSYFSRRSRAHARAFRQNTYIRGPKRAASRYETYRSQRATPGTSSSSRPTPAIAGALAAPMTPLQQEFANARQVQDQSRKSGGRFRSLRRRKWFWPAVGVPAILVAVALLALSPILWSTFQAYRNVTVDSVEHFNSAYVPQLNVEGTPELVARATEAPDNQGWSGDDRLNILLLGVDIEAGGASRTDTLILVNIDPVAKSARMMSIPRDLKVVIPGYGVHKINAAFALGEFNEVQGGGAGLTIRTIESNLGIPVHGFVQIDFHGFTKMIDTVGGVMVDVPYPIRDDEYPAEGFNYQRIYFPAGWQHLDGEEALIYARTRHQDGDSMRSARQQQVLMAIRDQAVSLDLVTQLPTLIRQFGDSVRTDITISDAVKLAQLGLEIPRDKIISTSMMPSLYETTGNDGTYYLEADWDVATDIFTEFHGSPINPPGAAISNPDYGASIMILNGTENTGLAGRVGTILEQNGYWNVSVDYADDRGDHDQSVIVDHDQNLGTSAMIASLIGVGADTILLGEPDPGQYDVVTGYEEYDIVIMLGNDAPDPAGDQWSLEDYQRETGDDAVLPPPTETDGTADDGSLPPSEEQDLDPIDEDN